MTAIPEIIVPLDSSFLPTTEDKAVGFKIIPSSGIPYFVESLPLKEEASEFSARARKKKRIYKRKKTEKKSDA